MRLFVSLDVPRPALDDLDRALHALRRQRPDLRWIPAARWHVTVAFLGDVREEALDPLAVRLARVAARHRPLALTFSGSGRFGSRVLWAGVTGDREALSRLAEAVAAAARRAGVAVDERAHRPHLTLARGRTTPLDLRPLVTALGGYRGPSWQAASFSLVRSHLGPQPRYDVLATWQLTGV